MTLKMSRAAALVMALAVMALCAGATCIGAVGPEQDGPRAQRTTLDMASLVDPCLDEIEAIAGGMSSPDDVVAWARANIAPARDVDVYGEPDHWAGPAETLLHRSADCEDSAILVASILVAMGHDPMLLIIDADPIGHVAVLLDGEYLDQFAADGNRPPLPLGSVKGAVGVHVLSHEHEAIDLLGAFA